MATALRPDPVTGVTPEQAAGLASAWAGENEMEWFDAYSACPTPDDGPGFRFALVYCSAVGSALWVALWLLGRAMLGVCLP